MQVIYEIELVTSSRDYDIKANTVQKLGNLTFVSIILCIIFSTTTVRELSLSYAIMIRLTPLFQGRNGLGSVCSLLEIGGAIILLDCGAPIRLGPGQW